MNIRSVLAVTDFSPPGRHAVERAAMLAAQHRAILKLIDFDRAAHIVRRDAEARLALQASELARLFGITVCTVGQATNTLQSVAQAARGADLVVLSHVHRRSLAATLRGHPASQLMRLAPCPVLVTKRETASRYARMLVAVNFSPQSRNMVRLACLLDASAEVRLFHSLDMRDEMKLRSAEASVQTLKAYRQECMLYAQSRMMLLADPVDVGRNRVRSTIEHGDPSRQVITQQQYAGADLLVVGSRKRHWAMDFFAGSMAQRVLSWSTCDVLLVPHDIHMHAPRGTGTGRIPTQMDVTPHT